MGGSIRLELVAALYRNTQPVKSPLVMMNFSPIKRLFTQIFFLAAQRKNRNTGTDPGHPQRGLLACS